MEAEYKSKILIIDDESFARDTLEALLSSEGYDIELAENGQQGLKMAQHLKPDLVLLDVMMPGLDGYQVCEKLRSSPELREMPIIMVTALDDSESRIRGLEAGADDFLTKPYNRQELRARVRTVTRLNRYRKLLLQEKQLTYLTNYDSITGLPNRTLLKEYLKASMKRCLGTKTKVQLLVIALEGLQKVQNAFGKEGTDRMLVELASRFKEVIGNEETLASLPGNQLALMGTTQQPERDMVAIVSRLKTAVDAPIVIQGQEFFATMRAGVSVFPDDSESANDLVNHAEFANGQVISNEKFAYQFYIAEMNEAVLQRVALEAQLHRALKEQQFQIHYQPKIDLIGSRGVVGMEALIRWYHPERGIISPLDFIPLAEETGLIMPIGEWVLRESCKQLVQWRRECLGNLVLSVNLSVRQFLDPELLPKVEDILHETGLPPASLELELTESYLQCSEGEEILRGLKSLGIRLAIDDFGTGYSSLSRLQRLPVDVLKIDREFIFNLPDDQNSATLTNAIIAMAHGLGLEVVAEGVETQAHVEYLKGRNCDLAQGFLFSKPLPAEEFSSLLKSNIVSGGSSTYNSLNNDPMIAMLA